MPSYVADLQRRLIFCAALLGVCFVLSFSKAQYLYEHCFSPLLAYLPHSVELITTSVTAPFMLPIQLSFLGSIILIAPLMLWQIWGFFKPALYAAERQKFIPILISSVSLFYLGLAFGLFIVCPYAVKFFLSSSPSNIKVMLDLGKFLDFSLSIGLVSAIVFQIPLVTVLLIKFKIISKAKLKSYRRHIIVAALVVGMLLAPPDVVSQLLLALPMWGLFELGLLFG